MIGILRFLQFVSATLAKYTSLFIIGIAAITYFKPEMFQWVTGNMSLWFLGVIMLTMGLSLTTKDFKILAKRPLDILIGACAQFSIMPLLAFLLVKILRLPTGIAAGLILVGCCPGGVTSNLMTFLCRGDLALSVGMTTVSTLLAPVLTPVLMLRLSGHDIEINAWGMFLDILIVTIIPVSLGVLANFLFGQKRGFVEAGKLMPGISVLAFMVIIGCVVAKQGEHFFRSGLTILLAIFLHNTAGYLLGYLAAVITGMKGAKRRTLCLEVGMQNAGMATALAAKHFPAMPEAALAAAASCVWHSFSGTFVAAFFLLADKISAKRDASPLPENADGK